MLRYLFLAVILAASPALADADNGRRLALAHCATCHAVTPLARSDEVSAAPRFDEIAAGLAATSPRSRTLFPGRTRR